MCILYLRLIFVHILIGTENSIDDAAIYMISSENSIDDSAIYMISAENSSVR